MPDPFVIAHLSDLHLTSTDRRSRSEPKLFGKLKGMNAAFRKIARSKPVQECDLLLFTGDITDDGSIEAWNVFWKAIQTSGLEKKCVVVPGNHDVCCLGSRILVGEKKRFVDDLAKMGRGLALGGKAHRQRFPWVVRYDHPGIKETDKRVALFGLDSCNKGNSTGITNAIGKIGFVQLEKFARLLKKHREVPVKIVALHHSPNIPGKETARKRHLEEMSSIERWGMEVPDFDRRALRLLCLTHDVRLVVHGHVHQKENRYVNGVRFVGTPATTEPVKGKGPKRYGFWTYWVRGSGKRVEPKFVVV
jgi:3',5'-cyclic AMP phosphodiesterase CpdA